MALKRKGGGGGGGTTRYTITFNTQGGSEIASQKVNRNNTAVQPVDPIREGYRFMGWFTDQTCTQAYDFTERVTKNLTLYAAWEEIPPEPVDTVTHMPYLLGYEDGTFRLNESVKRIEAVKMINNMLGWSCDRDFVDNETHLSGFEFEDLERGSWEYYEVMEASLSHNCIHENGKEIWTKAAVAA